MCLHPLTQRAHRPRALPSWGLSSGYVWFMPHIISPEGGGGGVCNSKQEPRKGSPGDSGHALWTGAPWPLFSGCRPRWGPSLWTSGVSNDEEREHGGALTAPDIPKSPPFTDSAATAGQQRTGRLLLDKVSLGPPWMSRTAGTRASGMGLGTKHPLHMETARSASDLDSDMSPCGSGQVTCPS